MKKAMMVVAITMIFTMTAVSDVQYVKRYLAPLIRFADERNANLLVYDQHDQTRGLAVLSPGKIVDISSEVKGFSKPKTSRAAPSLSPDGTQVAFAQSSAGSKQEEVWVFDLHKGEAKQIAQFPGVLSVTWSPRGDALAVNTGGQLRTLILATKESKLIAEDISFSIASWSPDGHKITYESASGAGEKRDFHVNVVDVETGRVEKIAAGRCPSWSPRGDRIAYLDKKEENYWLIPPAGGQSSPLIAHRKKIPGDPFLSEPVVWSPDGHYVIVTGYFDGGTSITLVDLATSKCTLLHQGGDWLLAGWR